jgi:hypothetical protein
VVGVANERYDNRKSVSGALPFAVKVVRTVGRLRGLDQRRVTFGEGRAVPSNRRREATVDEPLAAQNSPQDHLTEVAEHTLGFFSETAANALEQLPHGGAGRACRTL